MKNRKAKILLVRRNARRLAVGETQQPTDGVNETLRDDGLWFLQKPSAAQNRWKNHLYKL